MKRILLAMAVLTCAAFAQTVVTGAGSGVSVQGAVTAGHCASYISTTLLQDAGIPCGGTAFTGGNVANATTFQAAGAASAPAMTFSGAPFTGGNGTTNFPLVYFYSTGTAVTTFNTAGSYIGINAPSGFTGNFLHFFLNGTSEFTIDKFGQVNSQNSITAANTMTAKQFATGTNCSSSAAPAVCSSAAAGSVVVAAAATTVTVNTTSVTANSQINLTFDASLGTKLSVTCNTTFTNAWVSARTAGTSFTITVAAAPTTNPACFSYSIVN